METLIAGLKAAGEPTRLRLMRLLIDGALTVTELTHILGQSQPRVSRHLKLLMEAGLVDRFPEATWVFYHLASDRRLADVRQDGARPDNADLARTIVALVWKNEDPLMVRDQERLQAVKRARAQKASAYFRANAEAWDAMRALHVPDAKVDAAIRTLCTAKPVKELIDLGTGTGHILELLSDHVRQGVGIDTSREMLAMARANLERASIQNCQVRQGDIFSLSLSPGCADLVILHQVLHYFTESRAVIDEAARLLSPGGRLLIVDFAPHDLEFLRKDHAHRRLGFADDEVTRWCEGSGLRMVETSHLPPAPHEKEKKLTVTLWMACAHDNHCADRKQER